MILPARLTIALLFFVFAYPVYAQVKTEIINSGTKITLHSKVLNEDRTILVSLPESYNEYPKAHYPVLYASDGPGFFPMVSGQVHFLSDNFEIIPQMIVVCIDNPQRGRDLIPSSINFSGPSSNNNTHSKMAEGGDRFLQMIQEDIIPYIDSNYSTAPFRIFLGHSLGGLTAFNSLLKFPVMFHAYIAISPSLQFGNGWAIKAADSLWKKESSFNKILFFSDGNEGTNFHKYQLQMDSLLKEKKLKDFSYTYIHYENETHLSEPVKALYDGLRFIFPDWYPDVDDSKASSYSKITDHYAELSQHYGYSIKAPEKYIENYASGLLRKPANADTVIIILTTNVNNYPDSYKSYETLGDAYKVKDAKADALANYQ
ncbi:MAG: alpha/beta hydrolase, partial [Ginsengibacter sp.]